ncbi:hypothetical protein N7468_009685 [Penicillium chermesinum]|uniref:Uncharacterized protein n=1 Tax=Penicillium chermesinum TaxID=63820 RepID=A0A9W9NIK8_9EURO|nr:uncharacterized protein N7468_009685 [Penicillium chermesinum]KAJ5220481.1 hypothetical protein N7468_009685 [Penicillium chermesinum]KAJ6157916.1 hypothetical protein N7470_005508 [Penicillium chermesinum]
MPSVDFYSPSTIRLNLSALSGPTRKTSYANMCTPVQRVNVLSVQPGPIITALHTDVKFVLWLSFKITGKLVRSTLQLAQSLV